MLDAPAPFVPLPQQGLRVTGEAPQAIRKAAEEFEAVVLAELLNPVFEQIDVDGLGGGGAGERMFRPMLVQHFAAQIAAGGGVGFADAIARELIALQSSEATGTP